MSSLPKSWLEWISKNRNKISDGYEEDFVRQVLAQISAINPDDLIAQYPFKDSMGKNRRIDFVIRNEEAGYFLPIEVDGAQKDTNQRAWGDFLARQNDLLESLGPLLRFSNSQFFNNPSPVKRKINDTLAKQRQRRLEYLRLNDEQQQKQNELEILRAELVTQKALLEESKEAEKFTNKSRPDDTSHHLQAAQETLEKLEARLAKMDADLALKEQNALDSKEHLLEQKRLWAEDARAETLKELSDNQKQLATARQANYQMQWGVLLLAAVAVVGAIVVSISAPGSGSPIRQQPYTSTNEAPVAITKMSNAGICHAPNSTYYDKTKNFIAYQTLSECLDNGGRLPKR